MIEPEDFEEQLKANMGSYFNTSSKIPGDSFQPHKASTPTAPALKGKGMQPPFPIIPNNKLAEYAEVKKTDNDTFGANKLGYFDADLNAIALKEVALSKGLSVEEMLKQEADRKATIKLKSTEADKMDEQVIPRSFIDSEQEDIAALEAKLAEMKLRKNKVVEEETLSPDILNQKILDRQRKQAQIKAEKEREDKKLGIPKEMHDNPIIEKLRKKLSIQSIKPAVVTVEGLKFEMLPPAASLNLWILEKIEAGRQMVGEGTPLALTIKIATVSAALSKIEGEDVMTLFDVSGAEDALMARYICSQTLWEMFIGLPSRKDLFSFHPELALKLYEAFSAHFGNMNLETSLDAKLVRFVCPIDDCYEMYDTTEPASGLPPFCKVHGVPMENKGLVKEIRSVPLA